MLNSEKEFLFVYGWNDFFESQTAALECHYLEPARVIGEERNLYRLQVSATEACWATVRGRLRHATTSRDDLPSVGDWVLIEKDSQGNRALIDRVLKRKTCLRRRQVGNSGDVQVLSSNVDHFFIVTSLNEDLNLRRLERYLTVGWDSGARPTILLSKADLISNAEERRLELESQFPGVSVHALSVTDLESTEFLGKYLKPGTTSVLVGSSGVGKSTLTNLLIGSETMKTQNIREFDGKGRHTTTARALFRTQYGGLIIDTPGMRELSLANHEAGLSQQFDDIEELLVRCRFTDCQHRSEPGCAIKGAVESGALETDRWLADLKLTAEIRHALRKQDKVLASRDRNEWKKRSVAARERGRPRAGSRPDDLDSTFDRSADREII